MYIITTKESNIIIGMGLQLNYLENGYPMLTEEKVVFVTELVNVHLIETIPEHISEEKYCYTPEKGFYENPNYVEPDPANTYNIPDELFNQIKADYREQIAKEVSENGYNA